MQSKGDLDEIVLYVMITHLRIVSSIDIGAAVPARVEALIWTELQMKDAALNISGYRVSLRPATDTRRDSCVLQEVLESCATKRKSYRRK